MRNLKDLRLGAIGHGVHARANLYPSIRLAGGSVCSVVTQSKETARLAADALGANNAHDEVGAMLSGDELDAVIISLPPEHQLIIAEQCAQAGIAVFVEKPLGMSALEARRIADIADQNGSRVMVGFMKRYAPAYRGLAELIADRDRFGRIMVVDASFCFAPWDAALREDTYLKLGAIHIVDLFRSLFGEVDDVQGMCSSSGADIGMVFSLRFSAGPVANLTLCGVPAWGRENERVTVTGTHGWAEVENLSELRFHTAEKTSEARERWQTLDEHTTVVSAVNSPMSGVARDLYQRGFAGEIAHFLECVAGGKNPSPSARDNVATMELCERMLRAIS